MESFKTKTPHKLLSLNDPSEIRLVKIYPAEYYDPVRCELEHVSLSSEPTYWTLSYVWGDPNATTSIILDGKGYPTTMNLFSFLRHLQTVFGLVVTAIPFAHLIPESLISHITSEVIRLAPTHGKTPDDGTGVWKDIFRIVAPYFPKIYEHATKTEPTLRSKYPGIHDFLSGVLEEPQDQTHIALRIWIDALCINQTDKIERGREVARMRDIYRRSSFPLVWLGSPDFIAGTVDVSKAFHFLDLIARSIHAASGERYRASRTSQKGSYLGEETDVAGVVSAYNKLATNEPYWKEQARHFWWLTNNTWFKRAWCIQELAVCTPDPVILCGFFRTEWTTIQLASQLCSELKFPGALQLIPTLSNIGTLHSLRQNLSDSQVHGRRPYDSEHSVPALRLYSLLRQCCSRFKATDPRDLIYALLGLLEISDIPAKLWPDYDLPTWQVYRDYAAYIMQHTGDLTCLATEQKGFLDGPSWVPDWAYVESSVESEEPPVSKAGHVRMREEEAGLELDGVELGTLQATYQFESFDDSLFRHMKVILAGHSLNALDESGHFCIKPLLTELESRVIRFCSKSTILSADTERVLDDFLTILSGEHRKKWTEGYEILTGRKAVGQKSWDELADEVIPSWVAALNSLVGRQVGVLDNGQVVITSRYDQAAATGDVIYMLKGAKQPSILRKKGQAYELVGHCQTLLEDPDDTFYSRNDMKRLVLT